MARLKWMSGSELANAFGDAVACKGVSLEEVVAGIISGNPVRDGIDVEPDFLAGLRLANQHALESVVKKTSSKRLITTPHERI